MMYSNPESVILESVLEGMAEYYSLNLTREVRKGLKENALSARTTGGRPPLGYDVDRDTMKLVLNPMEAEAVKLIYKMYLDGCGYSEIIKELNANGFKTKRGQSFGKNSINSILKNEKYTGIYTYNLVAPKYKGSGKPIRYGKAENEEIVRIENAVPQIISKGDFDAVQLKMKERQHKAGRYNAKANYLLSGKIFCGVFGAPYTGNKRKARSDHPEYISYRCSKRNGKNKDCRNKEIRKEFIEELVLNKLSTVIFDDSMLSEIHSGINKFMEEQEGQLSSLKANAECRLKEITRQIDNLVTVIAETGSKAVLERLEGLEKEKTLVEEKIREIEINLSSREITADVVKQLLFKAKKLFEQGTLEASKSLIDLFVEGVYVYEDRIEIKLNIMPSGKPPKAHKDNENLDELFSLGKIKIETKKF